MSAIIQTIVNFGLTLLGFFRKFFPWIDTLVQWFKTGDKFKILKFLTLKGLAFMIVSLMLTSFAFFVTGIIKIYNLFSSLSNLITSSQASSSIVSNIWWFLNITGFLPAFNLFLPIVLLSIIFLLSRRLYDFGINTYKNIMATLSRLY